MNQVENIRTFGSMYPYKLRQQDVEFQLDLEDKYNTRWYVSADIWYAEDLDRHQAEITSISTISYSVDLSSLTEREMRDLEIEALITFYEDEGDITMEEKMRRL